MTTIFSAIAGCEGSVGAAPVVATTAGFTLSLKSGHGDGSTIGWLPESVIANIIASIMQ